VSEHTELPEVNPEGEYHVDYIARLTDEQLHEYRRQAHSSLVSAVDVERPKNVYQSAAYRQYRLRMTIQKIDDEQRDRTRLNKSEGTS
jgi:hypothetical protein